MPADKMLYYDQSSYQFNCFKVVIAIYVSVFYCKRIVNSREDRDSRFAISRLKM